MFLFFSNSSINIRQRIFEKIEGLPRVITGLALRSKVIII
jgi:hypothetical protein